MTPEELLKLAEDFEKQAFDLFDGDNATPPEKEMIASKDVMEVKFKIASLKSALDAIARNVVSKKSISWFKRYLLNRKLNQIEANIRDIFDSLK